MIWFLVVVACAFLAETEKGRAGSNTPDNPVRSEKNEPDENAETSQTPTNEAAKLIPVKLFDDPRIVKWSGDFLAGRREQVLQSVETDLKSPSPHPFAPHVWMQMQYYLTTADPTLDKIKDEKLKHSLGVLPEVWKLYNGGEYRQMLSKYPASRLAEIKDPFVLQFLFFAANEECRYDEAFAYVAQMARLYPNHFQAGWMISGDLMMNEKIRPKIAALVGRKSALANTPVGRFLQHELENLPSNDIGDDDNLVQTEAWLKQFPKDARALRRKSHLLLALSRRNNIPTDTTRPSRELKTHDEMITVFRQALETYPFLGQSYTETAAEELRYLPQLDEAEKNADSDTPLSLLLKQAAKPLETDSKNAPLTNLRRQADLRTPDKQAADNFYEKALAQALIDAGKKAEAAELLDKALMRRPNEAALHSLRAKAEIGIGTKDNLFKFARRAVELAPTNREFLEDLIKYLTNNDEREEAKKLFAESEKKFVQKSPRFWAAGINSLAETDTDAEGIFSGELSKQLASRVKLSERAVAEYPASDWLLKESARSLKLNKRTPESLAKLKESFVISPPNEWSLKLLNELLSGLPIEKRNAEIHALIPRFPWMTEFYKGTIYRPPTIAAKPRIIKPSKKLAAAKNLPAAFAGKPELTLQSFHTANITAVAYSPDGQVIASGDADGVIKLWEANTNLLLHTIYVSTVQFVKEKTDKSRETIKLGINQLAFSPDGKYIAANGYFAEADAPHESIKLWDVLSGELAKTLTLPKAEGDKPYSRRIKKLAFNPADNMLAATYTENPNIVFWNAENTEPAAIIRPQAEEISTFAFSQDGTILLSAERKDGVKTVEIKLRDETKMVREKISFIRYLDLKAKKQIHEITIGKEIVNEVSLSADGKTIAVNGSNLLDADTGNLVGVFGAGTFFSPDGKSFVSGDKVFDAQTGRLIKSIDQPKAYSPEGDRLVTVISGQVNTVKIFEKETKKEENTSQPAITTLVVSPDNRTLVAGDRAGFLKLWYFGEKKIPLNIKAHEKQIVSLDFSPDGKHFVSVGDERKVILWEAETGKPIRVLKVSEEKKTPEPNPANKTTEKSEEKNNQVQTVLFSPDGKSLVGKGANKFIQQRSVADGKLVGEFEKSEDCLRWSLSFSPDGNRFGCIKTKDDRNGTFVAVWDTETRKLIQILNKSYDGKPYESFKITGYAFNSDGKTLVTSSDDGTVITSWDIEANAETLLLKNESGRSSTIKFSPDYKRLLFRVGFDKLYVLDLATKTTFLILTAENQVDSNAEKNISYLPNNQNDWMQKISYSSAAPNVLGSDIFSLEDEIESRTTPSFEFSKDGKYLFLAGEQGFVTAHPTEKLFGQTAAAQPLSGSRSNLLVPREFFRLVLNGDGSWAVLDSAGRYDSDTGGNVAGVYWVLGRETLSLGQLKNRYHEPYLLGKIMGFNTEKLRDVSEFKSIKLNPEVKTETLAADKSKLKITLTNRGGGIGRVQVFVNDKEFISDARDEKLKTILKANSDLPKAEIIVDLAKAQYLLRRGKDKNGKPKENDIRVVAWNAEDWVSSRGAEVLYMDDSDWIITPPKFYAIVGGVSDYEGTQIDLKFASKDAADMARVLETGARKMLCGDVEVKSKECDERINITLLTDYPGDGRARLAPTKENFRKAFESARKATPEDIFVVYLSGHGTTLGRGSDIYAYLTSEARATDATAFLDKELLGKTAVTSVELTEWIKKIPALKQVMILDTCAAGAASGNLRFVDKKDLSGDQIRALERLKDTTGFYVLMGSAANAVSYETSKFGQGLLTRALLEGMKGRGLENDLANVGKLFNFTTERVPELAIGIGGIQKPLIIQPINSQPFPIGYFTTAEKESIKISPEKPLILPPRFLNSDVGYDKQLLEKAVRKVLRNESYVSLRSGKDASVLFIDEEEFPGAIRPTGTYTVAGDRVTIKLILLRDDQPENPTTLEGTIDKIDELAAEIVAFAREKGRQRKD